MNKKIIFPAVLVLAVSPLVSCGGGGGGDDSDSGFPNPPRISSTQIDRMGRAGVNTALTNPFFRESVPEEQENHDAVVDGYNAAADSSEWVDSFAPRIAANLAVLDGLDTVCGNQLLAGPAATEDRYQALSRILADDKLYVNTASGTCNQYLGVEANAVGVTNSDCGGRTPLEDTIDTTYSLLAAGVLSGVDDGIPKDADGTASVSQFPFLDTPN
ncbi:MAG: hypothetical protein U0136_21765 [Bdellovibrionota bacterium]